MSIEGCANRAEIISKFHLNEKDTGSPEVQIALITDQLDELAKHFERHVKDNHARVGMMAMIAKRKKLLQYLKNTDSVRYKNLISALGLRK